MDDEVETEMFRHYIADTVGIIVNVAAQLGGHGQEYPMFSKILQDAYKPKNPTDYMDSKQIIAYICDKLEEAGDAREAEI